MLDDGANNKDNKSTSSVGRAAVPAGNGAAAVGDAAAAGRGAPGAGAGAGAAGSDAGEAGESKEVLIAVSGASLLWCCFCGQHLNRHPLSSRFLVKDILGLHRILVCVDSVSTA